MTSFAVADLSVRYYDLVLAIIPLLFASGWLTSVVAAVSLEHVLIPVGVLAVLLIGHALFVEPPVGGEGRVV